MQLAKLTCPKCRAVLRPAKPVAEGKTVKCPKCEETFKAGEEVAEDRAEAKAKKPAPAAAAKPANDDDDGGTYAVLKDAAEEKKKAEAEERERRKRKKRKRAAAEGRDDVEDEDEDEDEDKHDIASELLRNLKSRDPRGATQEAIVGPANWLLRTALLGFFGWVIYFIVFMIPVAFPNIASKDDANQPQTADARAQ